ncbi:hypothetical protein [Achromobacter anxifer]|uniref:hypothetical protein n=1 Tax=Achromobacter anxifer TaxID=1287737 RepID=UPI0023F673C1|nr:hypothetical protein [Achromobacter anxifer]MDF8360192.1 hypothetical protein [Achromobacter anxifer]
MPSTIPAIWWGLALLALVAVALVPIGNYFIRRYVAADPWSPLMIRRILRVHGELLINITFCVIAIAVALLGYGERQQADESTITAQDGGNTAYAAKG